MSDILPKRNGQHSVRYENKDLYVGNFVEDIRSGKGVLVYGKDKSKYMGDWKNNLRDGTGKFTSSDGSIYNGQWKNDFAYGEGTI